MRRSVLAAALVAATSCLSDPLPPPRPPATVDWSLTSTDGRFQVEQRREGSSCRVEAHVLPNRPLWTSRTCVPADALAFLSPDGRRMLLVDAFPSRQDGDWSSVSLVSLWADGAVLREHSGATLLGAGAAADPSARLSWLRGSSAEAVRGAARAAAAGDSVQLDLADGRTVALRFDGALLAAPPRAPVAAALSGARAPRPAAEDPRVAAGAGPPGGRDDRATHAAEPPPLAPPRGEDAAVQSRLVFDEVGLYRWEDENGALHFGSGSQIPPRLRRRAVPVSTSVGVMPVDRPLPPPAGAPSARSAAQGGPAAADAPAPAGTPAERSRPATELPRSP
jgi:hypothetical protein